MGKEHWVKVSEAAAQGRPVARRPSPITTI